MNLQYKHTQVGYFFIGILLVLILYFVSLTNNVELKELIFVLSLLVIILALFATLTVEINKNVLKIKFGVGIIRKSFNLNEVVEYEIVRNKWYYFWGIRLTPHGLLFCISGLDAVAIKMINGKRYRIGTNEPKILYKAIDKYMKSK